MRRRRSVRTAGALLVIALAGCGGTTAARPAASARTFACSADPYALAGDALPSTVVFAPAERFPHTRACVWWSLTLPAYRVEARVDPAGARVVSVCRFDERGAPACPPS